MVHMPLFYSGTAAETFRRHITDVVILLSWDRELGPSNETSTIVMSTDKTRTSSASSMRDTGRHVRHRSATDKGAAFQLFCRDI